MGKYAEMTITSVLIYKVHIGGFRCHDLAEEHCILSQLGSGPTSFKSVNGFYTAQDYREILQYATDRHIEILPEIDVPGHCHAAIIAMEQRRKRLEANPIQGSPADQYLLSEPDDPSKYLSVQYFTDNSVNPCLNSTYAFMEKVFTEIVRLHEGIAPLKTFIFGGDQVAEGAWLNSTACEKLIESDEVTSHDNLMEYFVKRTASIMEGYDLGAWEDGVLGKVNDTDVAYDITQLKNNGDVYAYAWQNIWEWGVGNRAYKLANAGYKTVMTQATHTYFDHPYEPDPEERGLYWATRFIDTEKTFGFMPDSLYDNIDFALNGEVLNKETECARSTEWCLPLEKPENIVGMEGELWSETVRTGEQLDYMIFPRILALAERAWHKADWEYLTEDLKMYKGKRLAKKLRLRDDSRRADWERFAHTLGYKELGRLDALQIKYRVSLPGARVVDGKLEANTGYPGETIQYSSDGNTWNTFTSTSSPSGTIYLRTITPTCRTSRQIQIQTN
ncbi:unnamed protein product [Owenia fusiformis]|uniref:beta-N-acetylhexosaminidase n=1 Tax=Owenia fusiformis TaxID=6347 RepID=A0A8S4PBK5_OWEFU|nr:unnamed protein product [Owenia fusiformis]